MLVLSRKQGEEIVIGSNVYITVLAVRGNRVKLGITAPREVVVERSELADSPESRLVAMCERHVSRTQTSLAFAEPC